ncbi:MAG TPA: hypothetical protein VGC34_05415 [Steroidobacteraceae bacterium]
MSTSLAAGRFFHLGDCIESVGDAIFLPGEADCARARDIRNAAVEHRPCVIIRCRSVAEVLLAVRIARIRNLPVSVRTGSSADRSLPGEGIVLDMSEMGGATAWTTSGSPDDTSHHGKVGE